MSDTSETGARPFDRQRGIVEAQAALGLRRVERAHHIEHARAVAERLIAVREVLRHVHHEAVGVRQFGAEGVQIGWRTLAHVDDDVVDRALDASHELDLGLRRTLEMHAAHRAGAHVAADIALDVRGLEPLPGKFLRAEGAGEQAALVNARLEVD